MFCSVKTCLHIYVSLNIFKYSLKHKCIITDTREPIPVREAIFSAAVLKTVKQYFNLVHINRDIIKIIIPWAISGLWVIFGTYNISFQHLFFLSHISPALNSKRKTTSRLKNVQKILSNHFATILKKIVTFQYILLTTNSLGEISRNVIFWLY